tara:strand:- start:919 stop:1917 length:999 start_codon:yes stop_codon:yes gene_type:complete
MANYSGREFTCTIGLQDLSSQAIGSSTVAMVSSSNVNYRLTSLNDIAFDAGFQSSEYSRVGRRVTSLEDYVQHYGSGTWTWAFEYLVENEIAIQNLLSLINDGADVTTACTIAANPSTISYAHGATSGTDRLANVIINNPETDEDRVLHNAVLQDLTLSMDMNTEAGRLMASGNFMSGYKPLVDTDSTAAVTTNVDFEKGIFDCDTRTVGATTTVTTSAFSITISNPASRIGFQGASGETDGYVRGGKVGITGSITVKYDSDMANLLTGYYQTKTVCPLTFEEGSDFSFSVPKAILTGHNIQFSDEGVMLEVPFIATSGANGGTAPLVIKCT